MQDNRAVVIKTLWGALLFSHFIFMTISYMGLLQNSGEPIDSVMRYALYGIAAFNGLVSFVINIRAKSKKKHEEYFVLFIMSCAFAESINIFGVVAQTMGLTFMEYLNFAIAGIILHIYYFPKEIPIE